MSWKTFGATFGAVFLAELGDKTQLATLAFASATPSRWAVFAGSALALVATSAIAVLGAEGITRLVSPLTIQRLAGVAFVIMGAWVLWATRSIPG
jgi:putative Ca2+/H+ antiporter (TMEM165/GDT1 family)